MNKVVARLVEVAAGRSQEWFDNLKPVDQRKYLKENPNSKFGKVKPCTQKAATQDPQSMKYDLSDSKQFADFMTTLRHELQQRSRLSPTARITDVLIDLLLDHYHPVKGLGRPDIPLGLTPAEVEGLASALTNLNDHLAQMAKTGVTKLVKAYGID